MLEKPRWYDKEWLALGGLLVLALALRLIGLGHVPPGVRFDELVNVKMADRIYAGEWPIYFQEAWGHEPLYHYFHALGMSLFGRTVLGVRITSVLLGTLGVLTTYLFFRRLYGRAVASVAALLLATSMWSLVYSRVGLRHISLPPWVILTAYCFWRGLEEPIDNRKRVMFWFALGGACAGVMLYTYFASRAVPILLIGFPVYLLLFHRHALRGRWAGMVLFYALPVLIVIPMYLYLRQHPELEQRLGQVGGELFTALRAGDLNPLLKAVLDTLKMFSLRGDPEWLYNISGRPVLDPVTSVAFYIGLARSIWRWRDPRRAFTLLWLAAGIAPSVLSWPPGSLGHTIVAQPATMGVVALGLIDVWAWAKKRAASWLRWGGRVLVLATLATWISLNSYDYYVRWPQFPEVRHEYQAPITAVARYLDEHPSSMPVSVSAPYVDYWNPWSKRNFDLYAGNSGSHVRWFDGSQSIVFPAGGEALFFVPDHVLLPSDLDAGLGALLQSGAQPIEIDYRDRSGSRFDLYLWNAPASLQERLASVSAAQAWASPETVYVAGESEKQRQAITLPLDFGRRLSLLGYTFRGDADAGKTWQMVTYWHVLDADSSPLAIFCHVLDEANIVRAGWDGLYVSSESWQTGDTFIHVHALTLPADLSPGEHRIELGVYSPVTQERLSLLVGDQTAPYDRALLNPLLVE